METDEGGEKKPDAEGEGAAQPQQTDSNESMETTETPAEQQNGPDNGQSEPDNKAAEEDSKKVRWQCVIIILSATASLLILSKY